MVDFSENICPNHDIWLVIYLNMRVLFFAQIKDATGCDSVELAPASPLNAEQLWSELVKQFPKLAAHRANVAAGEAIGNMPRRIRNLPAPMKSH